MATDRPKLAYWLKRHWGLLSWLPWGGRVWSWADDKVEAWHQSHGR